MWNGVRNATIALVVFGSIGAVQVLAFKGPPADNSDNKSRFLGDLDCDGDVDFDDIDPFVLALSGQQGYEAAHPDCEWLNADCDGDGDVDFDDIDAFVDLIGTTPPPGEVCETAIVVDALPYFATDSTTGFDDDYDAVCPYAGSIAPDVVFSYTPTADGLVDVDLCESGYDTKVYIYENDCTAGTEIACNDDACYDSQGNPYRSRLEQVQLFANNTYYIVVDGYGSSSGFFDLIFSASAIGACCFPADGSCADDYTEADCVAAAGVYQGDGTNCADIECPSYIAVVAPGAWDGSTCDELVSVCALRPSLDTRYLVTIPNDGEWVFSLCGSDFDTYLYLGTTFCGEEVASNDDYCGLQSEVTLLNLPAGDYFVTIEAYGASDCGSYFLEVYQNLLPCELECPAGAVDEQEPCGADLNGGCLVTPAAFEPLTDGVTVCGTAWADGGTRDTDWYELVLTQPAVLTLDCVTDFEGVFGLVEQIEPGVPGCDNTTGYISPWTSTAECEPDTLTTDCLPGGTYYMFVTHLSLYEAPCGSGANDYQLTVTGQGCLEPGPERSPFPPVRHPHVAATE